jgi:CheY-like chemotaxis protein
MSCSVLVVDDDAGFRDLASRILTGWGHVVVAEAGSVAEALERAAELRPDTALVDIGLPDGDGFGLARQLAAMPWAPRVVLTSTDADRANAGAARRAGASGFLPKDELAGEALRRLLEGVGQP